MENITQKDLKTLYDRIAQYCIAKHGEVPDEVRIDDEGDIMVDFNQYYCGDVDTETHEVSLENLTADLDEVVAERKREEEKKRLIRIEEERQLQKRREERALQQRKADYLKLKKEFGDE